MQTNAQKFLYISSSSAIVSVGCVEQQSVRQAHNLKVVGANPTHPRFSKMKTKSKPKAKTKPKKATTAVTLVAFLLDRSGSMSSCKDETISGFNAYVKALSGNIRFTLTQFDSQGIDIIHDAVHLGKVDQLTDKTYQPRGGTPLYDAIGKTVRATEKQSEKKKVLFVTLTDGQENASCEFNCAAIRQLIKDREADGWTFAHIGVGLEGFTAAQNYSHGTQSASNVARSSHGQTLDSYQTLASVTSWYAGSSGPTGPTGAKGTRGGQVVNSLWAKAGKKEKKPSTT